MVIFFTGQEAGNIACKAPVKHTALYIIRAACPLHRYCACYTVHANTQKVCIPQLLFCITLPFFVFFSVYIPRCWRYRGLKCIFCIFFGGLYNALATPLLICHQFLNCEGCLYASSNLNKQERFPLILKACM